MPLACTTVQPNITLIGMPGSGKSTLGKRLAKIRRMQFIDTDLLVEKVENMPLQEIVNRKGINYLTALEGRVLSQLDYQNHVIATGGSAIYSAQAMAHLGSLGARVYLKISLRTLTQRVDNVASRGLAKMKTHSLPRLYSERAGLYEAAADVVAINDRPATALSMSALNQKLDAFFNA